MQANLNSSVSSSFRGKLYMPKKRIARITGEYFAEGVEGARKELTKLAMENDVNIRVRPYPYKGVAPGVEIVVKDKARGIISKLFKKNPKGYVNAAEVGRVKEIPEMMIKIANNCIKNLKKI